MSAFVFFSNGLPLTPLITALPTAAPTPHNHKKNRRVTLNRRTKQWGEVACRLSPARRRKRPRSGINAFNAFNALNALDRPLPTTYLKPYKSAFSAPGGGVFRKNAILFGLLKIVLYLRGAKTTIYAQTRTHIELGICRIYTL